ncbi:MAG: HAMP domain-containing histidine kinase, partial [Deltaproteobacteria bacterium]|nr:HAMP domain-containing histidine kinase [Deltaproteobacteria bacterium]
RSSTERLLAMTLDLLDIGCAEDGSLALVREPVDVTGLIDDAVAVCRPVARHREVNLRADAAPGLVAVLDARLVRRVLGNLLDNAVRYVPAGGGIEVGARRDGDHLVLRVANDGPTIPPDARVSLFDKYARAGASASGSNRGLGLYLCRLVAEAHGGAIALADRAGGGVAFEVRIPGLRPIAGIV